MAEESDASSRGEKNEGNSQDVSDKEQTEGGNTTSPGNSSQEINLSALLLSVSQAISDDSEFPGSGMSEPLSECFQRYPSSARVN